MGTQADAGGGRWAPGFTPAWGGGNQAPAGGHSRIIGFQANEDCFHS